MKMVMKIPSGFMVILSIGTFIMLAITGCTTTPKFETIAQKVPPQLEREGYTKTLPIFLLPEVDIKNGNGLVAVFISKTKKNELSITVIFKDEDHPSPITDFFYDIYRRFKYHRTMDVETFFYRYNESRYSKNKEGSAVPIPVEISFPNTYSKDQVFFCKNVKHYTAIIPFKNFLIMKSGACKSKKTGEGYPRPLVFVNTWNHMFGERNNNLGLKLTTISNYPVYYGSREDVEKLYRGKY